MTEPLQVDTDGLDAASAILKSAAGQIPTQLPQFSVNGSDPLSAAIRAGSAQMEAPMAALPGIHATATTTAENIGVAGQRYRETDETLAQKAKEQQFPTDGSKPPQMGVDPNPPKGTAGEEQFSWQPTPTDVATGTASGVAQAAHDGALKAATQGAAPGNPLLNWTRELEVKALGKEIPGVTRAGGLLGVVTAIPSGIVSYSEAKAAGASTQAAIGQAVAREGAGTAAGLFAGGLASAVASNMVAGAAIGSVVPGVGTAVGLVAGLVVGGGAALLASKGVGWLFSG
jgi:hypothetical protein